MRRLAIVLNGLVMLALLSACAQASQGAPPRLVESGTPFSTGNALPNSPTPTAVRAATLAATRTATRTAPAPATLTPTASATATVTATSTPDPMSIAALRSRSYPGSEITIEKKFDPGSNYHRYYASYLSDGLKIYGLLTVPMGDPPPGGWPAIIFNHGYIPPEIYQTTERYVAYQDWLARAGYVVYKIDYRGHDQSEGQALGAYGDPGYTIDVLNAVASIQRYPGVNPDKIGMWGHSMGGFLTLRAMVISPDIKAGVIWSGVVADYADMLSGWRRNEPTTPTAIPGARRWRNMWILEHGTPDQNPEFWNSVSANAYLSDLSGPLQLHASTTDEEVPYQFSVTLDQQLHAAGKADEFYTYTGDNHNLSYSFGVAMTRTLAFFQQYLKGE